MSQQQWTAVDQYLTDTLVPADAALDAALQATADAGLPAISVSPNQGRLLHILALSHGARNILEIGTLGGYSAIWLARALPPGGRLITLEADPHHAEVARANLARAGLAEVADVRLGKALDTLPQLAAEGHDPFDLVFIDADKAGYPGYLDWAAANLRVGGTVIADNVFRRAAFPLPNDPPAAADGIRLFNETLARSGRFRATLLPLEDGFAVGVKLR